MPLSIRELSFATGSSLINAERYVEHLNEAMNLYNISDTKRRMYMFLANVGHESGGLRWSVEIWGPTPAQSRYEGRKDLGNTQPGDGRKFRGHGLIQTTGRYNHKRVRDRLRARFPEVFVPDFEKFPRELAISKWAVYSACDFADMVNLNAIADIGNFDAYCDTINRGRITPKVGDSNGWEHRLALYTPFMGLV
jgi:putative chitinase